MKLKKKTVLIASVLVAVLLAGTIGGVALAQIRSTSSGSGTSLWARVATMLGIDQQKLESAVQEAQRDMQVEDLDARLKALVENGTLTQQQADQYKMWWQSMPALPPGAGLPGQGGPGMRGFGGLPPALSTSDQTAPKLPAW